MSCDVRLHVNAVISVLAAQLQGEPKETNSLLQLLGATGQNRKERKGKTTSIREPVQDVNYGVPALLAS